MRAKFKLTFAAQIILSIVGSNRASDEDSGEMNQEIESYRASNENFEKMIQRISNKGPNENVEKSFPLDSEYYREYIKSVEKEGPTPLRYGLVQPLDYDSECIKKLLGIKDKNEFVETVEIDVKNIKSKADTVEIDLKTSKIMKIVPNVKKSEIKIKKFVK